jgi:hypothetical protein
MQLANRKERGRPGFISQDAEYGSEDLITTTNNEWCHGIMKLIRLVRETDIHDQSHRLLLGTLVKCNKSTYASLLYTCATVHFLRDCKYLYWKRLIPPLLLSLSHQHHQHYYHLYATTTTMSLTAPLDSIYCCRVTTSRDQSQIGRKMGLAVRDSFCGS